jgi:hypothetical protein
MRRTKQWTAALLAAGVLSVAGASSSAAQAAQPVTIPIAVLKGTSGARLIVAGVSIHRHRYLFLVDTGAATSVIDVRVARKLHLKRAGRTQRGSGVFGGGKVVPYRVSSWTLGGVALRAKKVAGVKLGLGPIKGLIGSDVLARFGRVSIDYANETMTLGG